MLQWLTTQRSLSSIQYLLGYSHLKMVMVKDEFDDQIKTISYVTIYH